MKYPEEKHVVKIQSQWAELIKPTFLLYKIVFLFSVFYFRDELVT
jgi:hypothetical protein